MKFLHGISLRMHDADINSDNTQGICFPAIVWTVLLCIYWKKQGEIETDLDERKKEMVVILANT